MGIGSKCVSEDFQELSFSNFQAFLRRGCISFNPFLSNLDNSPHLTVFYSRFLLDAFIYTRDLTSYIHAAVSYTVRILATGKNYLYIVL